MEIVRSDRPGGELESGRPQGLSHEQMVGRLRAAVESGSAARGLQVLCDYVGASAYLLARCDLNNEAGLDYIETANWPFDLVRRMGAGLIGDITRQTELERCMAALSPAFALLPDEIELPPGISRQFCAMTFNAGVNRYSLMLLCPEDVILSQQRLREVSVLASYVVSLVYNRSASVERELDLTEREIECLYWIAEGKTSDEIATILGISRNTINNYITSIMRKTATKTRSEAIAFAVRHSLV